MLQTAVKMKKLNKNVIHKYQDRYNYPELVWKGIFLVKICKWKIFLWTYGQIKDELFTAFFFKKLN